MTQETLTRALLRVALVAALVWLAAWLLDVLLLVFAGLLIAVLLRAPADWLAARTRLSPNLAIGLVLLVLVLALAGTGWAIAPAVGRQFDEMIAQLPGGVQRVTAALGQYEWGRWVIGRAEGVGKALGQPESLQNAGRALSTTFGALASGFVVLVVGLWVALQPRVYFEGAIRLFPVPTRTRARAIARECGETLRYWLIGTLASMLIIGLATWLGLWLLGVPLALVLALLAAALVFIPNFGPILSAIPAILLALTQGPETALWVAALYVGIQAVDNVAITPLIQRRAVSLPPALTIASQTLMGVVAGPLGVIVATPLTALALVLVRRLHVDRLEGEAPAA